MTRILSGNALEVEGVYMETLLQLAHDEGLEINPMLQQLGLDKNDNIPPEKRFSYNEFYSTVDYIENQGVEGLGLKMGQREGVLTHGMLGYACIAANTLRDALETYIRYAPHIGLDMNLSLGLSHDMAIVSASPHADTDSHLRLSVEEIFSNWVFLGRMLKGGKLPCHEVHFSYPKPVYEVLYNDTFHCTARFDAKINQIVFPISDLDTPFITANSALFKICSAQCETIYVRHAHTGSLSATVRRTLMNHPEDPPKIAELAEEFGLSARSLRRYLRAEGTSYQQTLHEVRMELAADYLRTTAITPEEISYLIGYAEVASFYRNFKRWSGTTPQSYRMAEKI